MNWKDSRVSGKTFPMKWNFRLLLLWTLPVAGLTAVCFLPVFQGGFLDWDDSRLFVQNPYYRGLSPVHWQWMCTTFLMGHWQPLSWLSCALDYTVWGMNPHGWHATNLLLHTVNAVLVYLLCLAFLRQRQSEKKTRPALTGTPPAEGCPLHGRGGRNEVTDGVGCYVVAALAALFWAVHPLRVEAVAWLATRGYLLCGTFCLLTVLFYLRAVKQKRYPLIALLCFALATFTKGIGMMLPLVLLLIDWLEKQEREFESRGAWLWWRRRVTEKIPFFLLSLLTGVAAFWSKNTQGGMVSVEQYQLGERFGQALYGIWFYLLKTVLPVNLSPLYYKRPEAGPVMIALVLTAAVMVALFLLRRRVRPVMVALGAFLLLVFPMLGFTQSGPQLFADRFTYLPAVPFSILLAAGLIRLTALRRLIFGALIVLLLLFGAQTAVWAVSWNHNLTLWLRAASVDKNNAEAFNNAGLALMDYQHYGKALEYFTRAVQLKPGCPWAMHNRAMALSVIGRYDEAFSEWEIALALPDVPGELRAKMLRMRGWVFEQTGNFKAAADNYSSAVDDDRINPVQRADILQLRAALYVRMGQKEKALADLKTILELPDLFGDQRQKALAAINEISKEETP